MALTPPDSSLSGPEASGFLLLPSDGLILLRTDGRVCFLDSTARRLMGADTPDLTGRRLDAVWPELVSELEESSAELTIRGPLDREVRHRGRTLPLRLFRSDDGVGIALLADGRQTPPATPQLVLLEGILREVRDAVIVTTAEPIDPPGPVIVFANPAALEQTGYRLHEVLGRSPRLFQGVDTDPSARAVFRRAMQRWQPVRQRILNYTKAGEPFWVEINLAPIAAPDGWFSNWVSVQRECVARPGAVPPQIPIALS